MGAKHYSFDKAFAAPASLWLQKKEHESPEMLCVATDM